MIIPTATTDGLFRNLPWILVPPQLRADVCAHCRHAAEEYEIKLGTHAVEFMRALVAVGRPAMKKDLPASLSKNAYSGGHIAQHWRLVDSPEDCPRGPWSVTTLGALFLQGAKRLPRTAVMFPPHEGPTRIVRFTGEPVTAHQLEHPSDQLYEDAKERKRTARRTVR